MSNSQKTIAKIFEDIEIVAIPFNMIGMGTIVWKIRKVRDPKINKTFSLNKIGQQSERTLQTSLSTPYRSVRNSLSIYENRKNSR